MNTTITDTIVMVRPASFGYNAETAENNAFQSTDGADQIDFIKAKALQEFDHMVETIKSKGVLVIVHDDDVHPTKPDAVFPNNWFSCHNSGEIITFPMYAESRKIERNEELINKLINDFGFTHRIGLEAYEDQQLILEGTGSMILDRTHKICYACLSLRTNEELLDIFCEKLGYKKVSFTSVDMNQFPIYHTNVMMALGKEICIICLDSILDDEERRFVENQLVKTEKSIVNISQSQMNAFAGNMLEVKGNEANYLVMSASAYESLTEAQIEKIESKTNILSIPIPTIEKYGGGSVRCMMAEVFYPKN